jgi:hypothetical protein
MTRVVVSVEGRTHTSDGNPDVLQYDTTHLIEPPSGNIWSGKSLFTAPATGIYMVSFGFVKDTYYHGGTDDDVFMTLRKNADAALCRAWSGQGAGRRDSASHVCAVRLNRGETLDTVADSDGPGLKRHLASYYLTITLV